MKNLKVTRIIHPIGQGGFYTETLSYEKQTKNFVYDCGGFNHKQDLMEKYLDCYLDRKSGKKEIEAVFISHFHADHMNGLQYLLENSRVKYLFLPQLTEDVLIESFVYNYCQTGTYNQVNRFLMDLYDKVNSDDNKDNKEGTRIIQIREADDSRFPEEGFNIEGRGDHDLSIGAWNPNQRINLDLLQESRIPSGTILYCGEWLYIPFNPIVAPEKKERLRKELVLKLENELGISLDSRILIKRLSELLKDLGVEKCKEIYNSVFHNQHNSYSMTLFSGTISLNVDRPYHGLCHRPCKFEDHCFYPFRTEDYCCNPNFLYTGDFEPDYDIIKTSNINQLREFYRPVWREIASIQVPHHGSKHNFDEALYKYPIRGIVSVGNNNPYHHPDIDTLIKIQEQDCHPVIVTEDKSSMKIYHYKCSSKS